METLGGFLARNPKVKQRSSFSRNEGKPYNFDRKVYPAWYLTGNQYRNLFRNGYPRREPDAFAYDRRSHNLMALYDCKQEIAALIEGIDVR